MMSYTTRPMVTPWKRNPSEDCLLSKSLGDIPGFELLSRASSAVASVEHRGYLLKRSNDPFCSVSPSPTFLDEHDVDTSPQLLHLPQHLPDLDFPSLDVGTPLSLDIQATVDEPIVEAKVKSPIQRSSEMLAGFFGLEGDEPETLVPDENMLITPSSTTILTKPAQRLITPATPQRHTITRSSPITFGSNNDNVYNKTQSIHRRNSVPSETMSPPQADFVDPKDGHIWRAKYCVLEDGVLYFYRNATDGESPEAHAERMQHDTADLLQDYSNDLSKSPMPQKTLSTSIQHRVMWEKRVALDCVGAVRSAEFDYGVFAFELLSNDGDRLVLRASNAQELNEWLFQFHRSLASFVKNFMEAMDLHRPVMPPKNSSPIGLPCRLRSPAISTSLSHGHGRSGLHRRRATKTEPEVDSFLSEQSDISLMVASSAVSAINGNRLVNENTQALVILERRGEPEVAGGCPPEMERPATPRGKYIPPHMRKKTIEKPKKHTSYIPPHLRRAANEDSEVESPFPVFDMDEPSSTRPPLTEESTAQESPLCLGGCAHPIHGSIMDAKFKQRMSSRVGKVPAESYGCNGGGSSAISEPSLHWEVGAVSECGVRTSNEDAFLVCSSAIKAFESLNNFQHDKTHQWGRHDPGFFGIFDGHCGNEASRFVAERLNQYIYNEWKESTMSSAQVQDMLQKALSNLDDDFCSLCVEDGRNWESGSTAIVAAIVDEHLVVTNIGDCRAVVCRSASSEHAADIVVTGQLQSNGWTHLEVEEDLSSQWIKATSNEHDLDDDKLLREWYWKEMNDVHSPSREDEKRRIEENNGWITTETEIPGMGQLQRMDFCDEAVVDILKRCFSDRYNQSQPSSAQKKTFSAAPQRIIQIARVCGELAVSRAIGDRDFKANQGKVGGALGESASTTVWRDCPDYLPCPENHSGQFKGDLVSSVAESKTMEISHHGLVDEFLVLACDGLWDVMDPDDAVRVTRGLLFDKNWSARKAAARLAELAIHLGSSDNITVIVIRFFRDSS